MKDSKRITFLLDEDLHYQLKLLAVKKRTTLTEMVTTALAELIEREKAEAAKDE